MLQPELIYKQFLNKVNKNDTNTNIKIPKALFILIFNEEKRKWLDSEARQNENSDYIECIEELLELDKELTLVKSDKFKTDFELPENFYKRVSGYALTSKNGCKDNVVVTWFVKPKDRNLLLQNSDTSPSFEYQETIALINNNKVSVHKTDFNVDKMYLSYYREPIDLDIAGYTKIDGTPSSNIQTDLSKDNIEKIIDRAATEAVRNYQSYEQVQLALQRQAVNNQ